MENFVQYISANIPILVAVIAWSLLWKGIALWKSARRKQLGWFIALLVLNTVGILEVIYIFVFARRSTGADGDEIFSSDSPRKKII